MTMAMTSAPAKPGAGLRRAALAVAMATGLAFGVPTGPLAAQAVTEATSGTGAASAATPKAPAKPGQTTATRPRSSKKPAAGRTSAKPAAAGGAAAGGAAAGGSPAAQAAPADPPRARAAGKPADVPYDCRGLQGVSREVCVQCAEVPIYKRVVCEQKVFWSLCKGKRLFTDAYCQQNQSLGRGEGG